MDIKKEKCPRCGRIDLIIPSNNPLVQGSCATCINDSLDASKVEHFAFFCRTYNIPFSPNTYMILYKESKENVFVRYVETLVKNKELAYEEKVTDYWKDIEKEWEKVKTHTDLMLKLPTIRASFEERSRVKWGTEYTFAELIQLENLFVNTLKAYNITDPMRIDAIKKACKLSIKIDAIIESGEAKSIKDYTSAYQSFLKSAQIDELGQVATEGTIKTVADLYKYMEKNGFEFKFYDKEERDVVDKTIKDIKESIRKEISNATGLDIKIEEIKKSFRQSNEEEKTNEIVADQPLSMIIAEDYYEELEMEVDNEYQQQSLDEIEYDD